MMRILRAAYGVAASMWSYHLLPLLKGLDYASVSSAMGQPVAYLVFFGLPLIVGYVTFTSIPQDGGRTIPYDGALYVDKTAAARYWNVPESQIADSGLPFVSERLHIIPLPTATQRWAARRSMPRGMKREAT